MIKNEFYKKNRALYNLYYQIKTRCYNASAHNYPYYQGKGIKICIEWLEQKEKFFFWALQNGWRNGLSIDRIDSNKDYCPNNCRFISIAENSKKARKENSNKSGRNFRPKSKLNIEQVINIKELLSNGIKGVDIAKIYSVHKSCIYKIKHSQRWKNIAKETPLIVRGNITNLATE